MIRVQLLLDTHAFLWWLAGSERLSEAAKSAVADGANGVFVSAASAWEISTKHRLGQLPGAESVALDVAGVIANEGFHQLAITVVDAARAGRLPGVHRDPFDRMLIAQALARDLVLISIDPVFDGYGVLRLW